MPEQLPRLTIDEYAMALAHVAALRSEDPYTKVGAVALDHENRIIGTGYNGLIPGMTPDKSFWDDRNGLRIHATIHAEANLLAQFKRGAAKTVAITILPCEDCARNLVAHDVKRVLYGGKYWRTDTVDKVSESPEDILRFYGIEVKQVVVAMSSLFTKKHEC